MDRADFTGTDLRDALLVGVIASGSSFAGAQVEGLTSAMPSSTAMINAASARKPKASIQSPGC